MANSIKDIYNQIIEEKKTMSSLSGLVYDKGQADTEADALLADLDSGSKVSIWRLWAYVTAVVIFFHEKMWDLFKAEVDTKLQAIPGTDAWLAEESKKFQYGDSLVGNTDGTYGYTVIDESKQIVDRVAVTDNFGNAVVKVAHDNNGTLQPLSADELNAFAAYIMLIQYAGTTVSVVSGVSDKMQVSMEVYYDALIPLPEVKTNVETAINDYLSNLAFDGTFKVIKLIDALQKADGVKDISNLVIAAKSEDSPAFSPVSRVYNPASGYVELDPSHALSDHITYKAE